MSLHSLSNLQHVALLFLALCVLCSQSEDSECFKDSKVSGDCPSFSATLVRPGNFSVTLKADSSLSERVDVEMRFDDCKFRTAVYNVDGISIKVPGFRAYNHYLSFEKSGTQLVSNEDSKVFCSGLCQGDCDIHFSWDVKPSSSNIYLDFGPSVKLVDVRSNKGLSTPAIAAIIAGSIFLFLLLIFVATLAIYCCKCKKSKDQKAKLDEAKSKPQSVKPQTTKTVKQINSQDKKSSSNEKTREEKTNSNEKAPAKRAEFITSKDLASPPKIRKDKAKSTTSLDLKSPTKDKQKSSSQKEKQAPKQDPIPQVKKRTGKSTEATLERVLTTREDEKLEAKEAKLRAKNCPGRDFVTLERVLTTHEEEKLAAKEAKFRDQAKKKTKTASRDDATIVD